MEHAANADGRTPDPLALVAERGGGYAAMLGIDLAGLSPDAVHQWFLAAELYGARIPESVATRTWREFKRDGVLLPQQLVEAGWDRLVAILDRGGYVRYDYKTATKLLDVSRALLDGYGGSLAALHAAAADAADLERRIMALGKGIGRVTSEIFLREMRGKWEKADPPLAPLALMAAQALGYLPNGMGDEREALLQLQRLWAERGMTADGFADFESALVREGLMRRRGEMRHHSHGAHG
ncbi:hypothetical protein SKTS_10200 [Sulfurimicrobium lacus]|uniref:Uncharacterized protein n=1 Tax=Sulfurimicrobium lacus TaxID=2715678 RepID=A0A6F8V901_9PROT|nr:hypothetical protein [Sulfurimicrobium lacus]BCB26134.1 hypothetical protein SKTS_10200 [Sulfurimicrobium lacus]